MLIYGIDMMLYESAGTEPSEEWDYAEPMTRWRLTGLTLQTRTHAGILRERPVGHSAALISTLNTRLQTLRADFKF